jgi:glycosyltransferase involved in cell wall biosynthesis
MIKPVLVISCPASSRSGYGDHSRDLIRSLISMDRYDVKIIDQRWGSCDMTELSDESITSRFIKQMESQPDIWMQVTVPNEFQPVGKYNIGITAGMETTMVSSPWVEGVNRMDMVLVPSKHSKEVFEKTIYDKVDDRTKEKIAELKCTTPIEVLFEGLDLSKFFKTKDIAKSIADTMSEIKEDDCYLFTGHWMQGEFGHDRKDVGGMIRTFLESFKNKSPKNQPALILKTSSATFSVTDREQILEKIENIKASVDSKKLPSIYLIHGNLTEEELNSLYNHPKIKAMLSFTHGEGFGRPLLEFGVTGKPVIAPNWSGHVDFLGENGILMPGELKQVHPSVVWDNVIIKESAWFYVDYGYASGLLKDMEKNYKNYLSKSRKQTQYIKDNFTLDQMTDLFSNQLKKYVPSFEIKIPNLEELQTYE